jgi:hypothetical protein
VHATRGGGRKGTGRNRHPRTPLEPSPKGPPETESVEPPQAGEEENEMPALEESNDTENEEPQEEVPAGDGLGDARAHFAQSQDYPPDIWNIKWVEAYEQCDIWSPIWASTMDATATWPKDYKELQQRLYKDEKLCVPTKFTECVIMKYHQVLGHVGGGRLWRI